MKSNPQDPFAIKRLAKWHPSRVLYTLYAYAQDRLSRVNFECCALPLANEQPPVNASDYDSADTAVTPPQMGVLDFCVQFTDEMASPIIEVGAFRGVTTRRLASQTNRKVLAIDPYIGYGGADGDMAALEKRIRDLQNVSHIRMTSGEASRRLGVSSASFVFIDAVHDYVNVIHDGLAWSQKLVPGGLIAFHDTDSRHFPGVQRAVWKLASGKTSPKLKLFAHTRGLVVLMRQLTK